MSALAAARRFALPPGVGRWLRPLLFAAVAVLTIVVLALEVFPTRTWIEQREALVRSEEDLADLEAERESLEQRIAELDTDAEIEAIARSQYGLVKPGEEAYAIHPAPERAVELPNVWPFGDLSPDASASARLSE